MIAVTSSEIVAMAKRGAEETREDRRLCDHRVPGPETLYVNVERGFRATINHGVNPRSILHVLLTAENIASDVALVRDLATSAIGYFDAWGATLGERVEFHFTKDAAKDALLDMLFAPDSDTTAGAEERG